MRAWSVFWRNVIFKEYTMKALFILNGAPYGDEHSYHGLRLAGALSKRPDNAVPVFLMGDAARQQAVLTCAAPTWMPEGPRPQN